MIYNSVDLKNKISDYIKDHMNRLNYEINIHENRKNEAARRFFGPDRSFISECEHALLLLNRDKKYYDICFDKLNVQECDNRERIGKLIFKGSLNLKEYECVKCGFNYDKNHNCLSLEEFENNFGTLSYIFKNRYFCFEINVDATPSIIEETFSKILFLTNKPEYNKIEIYNIMINLDSKLVDRFSNFELFKQEIEEQIKNNIIFANKAKIFDEFKKSIGDEK